MVCSFISGRIVRLFRLITGHPESWAFPAQALQRNVVGAVLWLRPTLT